MNEINNIYEDAIEQWRINKGIGTAVIPNRLDYKPFVIAILQRIYSRSPTTKVLVVTPSLLDRNVFIEAITHQEFEENNTETQQLLDNKTLQVLTEDFVKQHIKGYNYTLIIWIRPSKADELFINILCSRFKLIILDTLLSSKDMMRINNICPTLAAFKSNEIIAARTSTPVEEMLVGVDITEAAVKDKINKCEEYINTSLTVFGSFTNMDMCRQGNPALNISAMQMCSTIAEENGWSPNLDMSYDFNVQLDSFYNPNALHDRAKDTYDIIRLRSNLLSDYQGKLDTILDIVKNNMDKKILIINKRGEYASIVSEFINKALFKTCCVPYHDKLPPIPAIDCFGQPIFIKTGSHKGEQKIIGQRAQKTLNEKKFNKNEANILSTNASPDKDLAIDVQVIIITSPKCNNVEDYIYRLNNVDFPDGKITVYTLYCKDTTEEKQALERNQTATHKIVNDSKNSITFDENFGVIVGG